MRQTLWISIICLHVLHTYPKTINVGTGPVAGFGQSLYQRWRIYKAKGPRRNTLILAKELLDLKAREDQRYYALGTQARESFPKGWWGWSQIFQNLSVKASNIAEAPLPLLGNGPELYKAHEESSSRTIRHRGTTSGLPAPVSPPDRSWRIVSGLDFLLVLSPVYRPQYRCLSLCMAMKHWFFSRFSDN